MRIRLKEWMDRNKELNYDLELKMQRNPIKIVLFGGNSEIN